VEKQRLPYTTFDLPVLKIRRGYYSAVYFWREKMILEKENIRRRGLMQIFNKVDNATICGLDETLAVLYLCTGHWKDCDKMYPLFDEYIQAQQDLRKRSALMDWEAVQGLTYHLCNLQQKMNDLWVDTHDQLDIHALRDGEESPAFHAIMTIEGPGAEFAHLESVYLGILARATKVATNTRRVVEAAKSKPILFFADRFDRWQNQVADGYATLKAGAMGVATDAMGKWWGIDGMGTTPHALIAFYCGDTAAATLAFAKHYPNTNAIALVDFHNDCVATSLSVARAFAEAGIKLWGVRLDTSGTIVDKSVTPMMGLFKPTGVCPQLVENVRCALDHEGFNEVKIVVSGGFNAERIKEFERLGVPVDAYGVGSSLLQGNYDCTADIVLVDDRPMAKIGRKYTPGPNLKPFDWAEIEP
jgi:nicotinate phosphoribosyltransferase